MKWFVIFILFFSTGFAKRSLIDTDEKSLRSIHEAYLCAMKEGPKNEFVKFKGYFNMLLKLSPVVKEVHTTVHTVLDIYQDYFYQIESLCNQYPDHEISIEILDQLLPLLNQFEKEKIAECFILFQFGIGNTKFEKDLIALQEIIAEFFVKNRIISKMFENSALLSSLLGQEKTNRIRTLCQQSEDPLLYDVLYAEIDNIAILKSFWNHYAFDIEYLNKLQIGEVIPKDHFEKNLLDLLLRFSKKVAPLKKKYGSFID